MFEVTVSDHMMIAHSLPGDVFGPAQALHGATYVVEAAFARPDLDADGIVLDIGRALDALKGVLSDLTYRNLDDVPSLAGLTTTTEVLCREIAGAGRRPRAGHVKLDHAAAARLLAPEDPAVVDVAATGAGWVVDRAREDGVEVSGVLAALFVGGAQRGRRRTSWGGSHGAR